MKTLSYPNYTYCLLFCLQAVSQAGEIPKAYNTTALNQTGAWSGGVVPGANDTMLWNNLYTIPTVDNALGVGLLSQLGADLTVAGIKVTDVGGDRNLGNPSNLVGFRDTSPASSSFTLTLGGGGIDMASANQAMMIQSRVTLSADQTWNIGNANTSGNPMTFNNGEDLAFSSQAATVPFNLGNKTLTTMGTGQITITGGYALSNGTILSGNDFFTIQGGSSRTTSIASTVNLVVNAGTLRIQANSGASNVSLTSAAPVSVNNTGIFSIRCNTAGQSVTQSGNVTLNAGSGLSFQLDQNGPVTLSGGVSVAGATTWRVAGGGSITNAASITGNLTGSNNITYLNTATGATGGFCRLAGDNSGYSGTITLSGASGNRSLNIGTANAGSAAATWNVGANNVLQVNGVSTQLGTLLGSGAVTNPAGTLATITVGAGEFTGSVLNGAQPIAVTKTGPGMLRLLGANNYTGATTVSGGTLVATPDQTGVTAVTVADGATYSVLNKGTASTLTTGNVTVGATSGGTLQLDYGITPNPFSALLSTGTMRFNGPSTLKVTGSNLTPGTFPLIQYSSYDPAGTAVGGLTLVLPTRTSGSLTSTATGIDLTISATEKIRWNGDLSDNWDIDPNGGGSSGVANWKTTVTNASTRYIQGSAGTDSVMFDDTATGSGTVNLTTTLAPLDVIVNNTSKAYTFTGSGKLTGFTRLSKSGTGSLTLANTTPNDYSGGTFINEGTLRLGDGITAGAGQIAGNIENSGLLVINRPDDHNFAGTLTGIGTLEKAQASVATFPASVTLGGPLVLTAGKVKFAGGGAISDVISGSGEFETAGGTVDISGNSANTNTGMTTVSAGTLRLGKTAELNAVAGDITITGTGVLNTLADEQIPNNATLYVTGSSADSFGGTPGKETFANAVLNGSVATTQLILRSNANVTNTATVTQGILGVASNHTATINSVVMNSPTAALRLAASSNPSTLNIGAGGITASGGGVQVKFNTNNFDAILNLSGNVTTTGDFAFTNSGYTGTSLNVVRLNGTRTFDITTGLTTFAPDIADYIDANSVTIPGALVKTGAGAFVLDATCSTTHTGGTTISAGSMRVHGNLGGVVQVGPNASLGGNGTLSGTTTVEGAIAPGAAGVPSVGHLHSTSSLTFAPGSDYNVELGNWANPTPTPGTDWDHLTVNALAFTATPANKLVIHVSGTPTGFSETNKTLVIATSTQAITGFDTAAIDIDATGFTAGTGTWAVQLGAGGTTVELVYTASAASPYSTWATSEGLTAANNDPAADPDQDGLTNLVEFALNSTALSGVSSGKVAGKAATVGGERALTITLPVRNGVAFTGTTELTGAVDGVRYRIQASDELATWNLSVSEVTGADATAIQAGLPGPLPAGWTYRTFRSPGPIAGDPKEFVRVLIEPAS